MWIKQILLVIIGLAGAGFVAAGTFAFITMLGIVPRFAARTNTAKYILWYENVLVLGGGLGNFLSVREIIFVEDGVWQEGRIILMVYGFCAGMFVGCQAMAMAELLQVIPILAKRIRMQTGAPTAGPVGKKKGLPPGMPFLVLAIALGKLIGSYIQMFFGW